MKVRLRDIAQLQFGFYSKPEETGSAIYLQAKHFDDKGSQSLPLDGFIQIDQKNERHLLKDGDILLVGKGFRNFAWTYDSSIGPAIASSIFFVVRPDTKKVIPEFLTTVFNAPQTQAYFRILGAGSSILSIRKSELEACPVQLPPLPVQQKAVAIKQLYDQDIGLTKQIIEKKQKLYQTVINNLIFNYHE